MFKKKGPSDGRKYRMAMWFSFFLLIGIFLAGKNEVMSDLYSEFITGLGMLYFVYCSGNVGNKWILGKHGKLIAQMNPEESNQDEK